MAPQAPELEQRLSELQSQLDRISEVLDTWTALGKRQAHVVGELEARLSGWNALDTRLEENAARRLQELARIIEHEWRALRQIHQEPVNELRDQAASLTEVSLATASAAQTSFDRAEARLSALEATIHSHMTELSRDVHAAIAELRTRGDGQPSGQMAPGAPAPAWPLDGVMRLHNQLRESDEAAGAVPAVKALPPPPEAPPLLMARMDLLERTLEDERAAIQEAAAKTNRAGRTWQVAVLLLALGFAAAGGFAWWLQLQANAAAARAAEAERQSQLATDAANQRITTARDDAARQIAQARESVAKAQVVSDVLAAPDLVRVLLTGGDQTNRFSGQLLWSRSRGLVFSSSRLPPPGDGAYQLWLTTMDQPVSVGMLTPDSAGRTTIATDSPPRPRAVTGAMVTLEPVGGSPAPSGPTLLARAP